MKHDWPADDEDHLWGAWMADQPRKGSQKPTQYRLCIHPKCKAVQKRDAPNA